MSPPVEQQIFIFTLYFISSISFVTQYIILILTILFVTVVYIFTDQDELYRSILDLPDFDNVKNWRTVCDCRKCRLLESTKGIKPGLRSDCRCPYYVTPLIRPPPDISLGIPLERSPEIVVPDTLHDRLSEISYKKPPLQSPIEVSVQPLSSSTSSDAIESSVFSPTSTPSINPIPSYTLLSAYEYPHCRDIDPRAVLWKRHHRENIPCDSCPLGCMAMQVLQPLLEVATHPTLLQVIMSTYLSPNISVV